MQTQAPDSPQKTAFIDYLYENVARAIQTWDEATALDAYAVWLRLALVDEDVRDVVVQDVGYATNTESERELAEAYGSKWSPGCIAHESELWLCGPGYSRRPGDTHGRQLRAAYLRASVRRFDLSNQEYDLMLRHSTLQQRLNADPSALTPEEVASLEEIALRCALTEAERARLARDANSLYTLYDQTVLGAFLDACGEVIQRLHALGILERKCGRPLPIGITFSNDIDERIALDVVWASNPPGLAREMEEEMMGRTYAQIAAEETLHRDLAARPAEEQAEFWTQMLLAEQEALYLNQTSPALDRIRELGLSHYGALWVRAGERPEVMSGVVTRLVPLIQERASPARLTASPDPEVRGDANEVAAALLQAITFMGQTRANREAVRDEDVERLHALLVRLFRESESLPRVGLTTFLVARTLHALRPERFPHEKFGAGGATANRLLNYLDFGLVKSDPSTPDYNEAAEAARFAARRQGRSL